MRTKIKKTTTITLVLTLILCFFSSCSILTETSAEKKILGKWYNKNGDCMEILSDNTYSIYQTSDYIYESGLDSGEWEYLEEGFFKFYANNYDGDIIKVEINEDEEGTYIEYTYYGIFYRD